MATKKELRALITLAGKVDPSLQSAMVKATGHAQKMSKEYKESAKHANTLSDVIKGSFIGSMAANGVARLIGKLKELNVEGLGLASNLKEVQNVVDSTFLQNAYAINKFSKSALDIYGLSELQAKKYTGTLGAMFKSSGIAQNDLVRLSTDLAGLSADMASFYNLDIDDAFVKIRSGMSGETEPLKQLGINMSVANMEAFALAKGIKVQYKNMSQAEQTLLRYNYLMTVTADQQGDFTKTQSEYANQQRLFDENLKQSASIIASEFLPYANEMLIKGNEIMKNTDFAAIAQGFGKGFELIGHGIKFVSENTDVILPLLGGVLSYFGAIKAINFASTFIGLANPISLAALVVGGLIAAGVALYQNWDSIKAQAAEFAEFIKAWGKSIKDAILYAFHGIKDIVLGNFQDLIDGGKKVLSFFKIDTKPKAATNSSGNFQKFASGGIATRPSIFGEAGPEMAIPLKRSPRSYELLHKTAAILGFRNAGKNSSGRQGYRDIIIQVQGNNNPDETARKVIELVKEMLSMDGEEARIILE